MALTNFFKTGDIWTVGDHEGLPTGVFSKKYKGAIIIVSIFGTPNSVIAQGLPTEFCDADGDAYEDLAAFKTATDSFFVKATGDGGTVTGDTVTGTLLTTEDFVFAPTSNPKSVQVFDANGNKLSFTKLIVSPYTITIPSAETEVEIEINIIY